MIDLKRINKHSVDELAEAILSGQYTMDDYLDAWIAWEKRQEVERRLVELEKEKEKEKEKVLEEEKREEAKLVAEEAEDWKSAEKYGDPWLYEVYKEKWLTPEYAKYALHLKEADERIDYLTREKENQRQHIIQGLLEDMRQNPWRYNQDLMNSLFNGHLSIGQREYLEEKDSDKPYAEFLLKGFRLELEDLIKAQIIPEDLTKDQILAPDIFLDAPSLKDMGEYPKDHTDVYFIGVPGSGKTTVLASIAYNLPHISEGSPNSYVPQFGPMGQDPSYPYYSGLVKAMESKKAPCGTPNNTVTFIKGALASASSRKRVGINLMDYSGVAIQELQANLINHIELWKGHEDLRQCLANNNRKVLFFVLDYSLIADKKDEKQCSPTKQIMFLEAALLGLMNDGEDVRNPTKGCTMSKVDTTAIMFTKCDLMGVETSDERMSIANEYLRNNFRNFTQQLTECNQKYGINHAIQGRPYILTYSVGEFNIGNTCFIDEEEPKRLMYFLANVAAKSNSGSKWWKF